MAVQNRPHPNLMMAGRIAARVLDEVAKEIKPGIEVLRICALAERKILEYGASGLAFPCNVSINEEAAHYTSPKNDKRVVPDRGLVKLDIGAHVGGYLSDTAITVDLDGSYEKYVATAELALSNVISAIRPGIELSEIGAIIERTIKKNGLKPVYQLSGHQMKPWKLHAGKSVPNVNNGGNERMELGEVFAVEPFSTDGDGSIIAGNDSFIFSNVMSDNSRVGRDALRVRNMARMKFRTLPWAARWIRSNKIDVNAAISSLLQANSIRAYPILVEGTKGLVAQAEHTIFVGAHGAIVTTKPV